MAYDIAKTTKKVVERAVKDAHDRPTSTVMKPKISVHCMFCDRMVTNDNRLLTSSETNYVEGRLIGGITNAICVNCLSQLDESMKWAKERTKI